MRHLRNPRACVYSGGSSAVTFNISHRGVCDLVLISFEAAFLRESRHHQSCYKNQASLIHLFLALLVVKKVALPLSISMLLSCMAYGYADCKNIEEV